MAGVWTMGPKAKDARHRALELEFLEKTLMRRRRHGSMSGYALSKDLEL